MKECVRHFVLMMMLAVWSVAMAHGVADVDTVSVADSAKSRLINEWEFSYGAGSPFGATAWREVHTTTFTDKFTQMWQFNAGHQYTAKDYGAASPGYYYPSIGAYVQWLDYSHLRFRGGPPDYPEDKTASYGQIISVGWTLHQYFWSKGRWRAHLNIENGAAYVFSPVNEPNHWVTLAKPWQILIGAGVYLDYAVAGGEISVGPHFTHMSNSGLASYNTGINNFSLVCRYRHKDIREVERCKADDALREKDGTMFRPHLYWNATVTLGRAFFESSGEDNPTVQWTALFDMMYRYNPNNGIGIGIDTWHNVTADRSGKRDYIGLAAKYDRWFGPFVWHLQAGMYLNGRRPIPWKGMSRIYEHVGFRYVMMRTRKVSPYVGIYTKANGFNAEQLGLGIGLTIR